MVVNEMALGSITGHNGIFLFTSEKRRDYNSLIWSRGLHCGTRKTHRVRNKSQFVSLDRNIKNGVFLRPHGRSENFIIFNLLLIWFSL